MNFISILKNTVVASTRTGVKVTQQFKNITVDTILARLKMVEVGNKDGSHFLRTSLKQSGSDPYCMARGDDNATSLASMLIIDCDKRIDSNGEEKDGAPDPYEVSESLKSAGIGHILFGSYSYYCGLMRYRIILATATPYSQGQLAPTAESIVALININLSGDLLAYASENARWSQPWYFPRKPADSIVEPLYIEYLEGNTVEMVAPQPVADITQVIQRDESIKIGEISPIHAFNQQNSLTGLLSHYGYKRILVTKEGERWLSPDSTSGKAGITVKDSKFFCHHSSGPFHDGYPHDAFDLMRARDGLELKDAIIKAAQSTRAPDGGTVDEYNKSLASKNKTTKTVPAQNINISFKEYRSFHDELLPVDPVPYEALPEQMAAFIKEQSIIRGCPPDYILVSLLARMGCVFAGKILVALTRNSGWHASPNFFWLMVGEPSSGKSNALGATNKPIQTFEALARELYKKEYRSYKADLDSLDRQLNSVKKAEESEIKKVNCDYQKLATLKERIGELQQKIYNLEDTKPRLKHYTINKLTIEKLILILEENPDGVLLELDELSSLFVRLSKDENSEERGLYLSGYNGTTPYSYKTIGRGDVLIPNVILSILGGIQPKKLKRFIHEAMNGYQDDGLLQRFQGIVFPDRGLYLPEDKRSDTDLAKDLDYLFENLEKIPSPKDNNSRCLLQFDVQAQDIFDDWRNETTKKTHEIDGPLNAHIGKSYEFVASLAAYLYLYENNGQLSQDKQIKAKYVLFAIKLSKYFLSHAQRMYGLAYKDNMPARSLSGKLAKLALEEKGNGYFDAQLNHYFFTRTQIRAKGWSDLSTKEQRLEAINDLIIRGYISEPLNGKYFINPGYLNE